MDQTKLIYKVLSGEASSDEKQRLEQWMSLSEENRMEYDDIKLLWDPDANLSEERDPKLASGLEDLMGRIRRETRHRRTIRLVIDAAIVLATLCLIYWFSYRQGKQDKPGIYSGNHPMSVGVQRIQTG